MDPQLKSILTSIALAAATSIAGYAASKGLIPSADQSTVANDLVTAVFGVAAALLAWYKSRQHTPAALVNAVNSDAVPGVKAVAASSPSPAVTISNTGAVMVKGPA
jgi:hypothetical protein